MTRSCYFREVCVVHGLVGPREDVQVEGKHVQGEFTSSAVRSLHEEGLEGLESDDRAP